ncbi:MAG: protein kinase [Planctomycetota bacterium]
MNPPNLGKTVSEHNSVDPYLGLIIDGAIIERKLGQGGMGAVYQARHLTLDKYIAIKILPPEFSRSSENIERFFREARSAAKLEHPNIIQVFNVGQENNVYFILMQFVSGQSLQSHLDKMGKIPLPQALWVMKFSMQGLLFAHEHGIIHRDLKPDNIMITATGEVKVVDFGLARSSESGNTLSSPGQIMGTPYFMSPEQCNGDGVDLRADIYSLGITFYYMLAGIRPYEGATAISILMQHADPNSPSKALDTERLQIPDDLGRLINRMMEKDPAKRYPNLSVALKDLEAICRTSPTAPLFSKDILPPPPRLEPSLSAVPTVMARPVDPQHYPSSTTEMDSSKRPALQKQTSRRATSDLVTIPLAVPQQLSHVPTMDLGTAIRKEKTKVPEFPRTPKSNSGKKILILLIVLIIVGFGAISFKKLTEKWTYQKQMKWVENQVAVLKKEKPIDFEAIHELYNQFQEQYPGSQKWCEAQNQGLIEEEKTYSQKLIEEESKKLREQTPIDFQGFRELYQPEDGKYPANSEWCEQHIRSLYEEELEGLFQQKRLTRISDLLVKELHTYSPKDLYPKTVSRLNSACLSFYESLDDEKFMQELQGKELDIIRLYHNLFILNESEFTTLLDSFRKGIGELLKNLVALDNSSSILVFLECFSMLAKVPDSEINGILHHSWSDVFMVSFFKFFKESSWTSLQINECNTILKSIKKNIRENRFCAPYFQELEEKIIADSQKYTLEEKTRFKQKISKSLFANTFPHAWEELNGEKIVEELPQENPQEKKSSESAQLLLEKMQELQKELKAPNKGNRPLQNFQKKIVLKQLQDEIQELFRKLQNEDELSEEDTALLRKKMEEQINRFPEFVRTKAMGWLESALTKQSRQKKD